MQQLQPKMFILTTVHAIAPQDSLDINVFQKKFCWCCFFSKMNILNTGRRKIKIFGEKISTPRRRIEHKLKFFSMKTFLIDQADEQTDTNQVVYERVLLVYILNSPFPTAA